MTKHYITDDAIKGIEEGLPTIDIPIYVNTEPFPDGKLGIAITTSAEGAAILLEGLWNAGGRYRTMGIAIAEQFGIKYSK